MDTSLSGDDLLAEEFALPDDVGQELEGETAAAAMLASEDSGASAVVLESNTLRGRVRFTNQNPEILALLDSDSRRFPTVSATSTSPAGYGATISPEAPSMRGFAFEMQVEAAAGGPAGVTYRIQPRWHIYMQRHSSYRAYDFQPVSVQVRPRSQQPEPTELDVAECIGVLRLRFGTDETCATPVPVSNLLHNGRYVSTQSASTHHLYFREGSSGTTTLHYLTGSSDYIDIIRHAQALSWNASCDEVVTQCVVVPGPEALGSLTGPWQIMGEQPSAERFLVAADGPEAAYRYSRAASELEAPAAEPSRWWSLPNLPAGRYSTLYGRGGLRLGREYTWFQTQRVQAEVTASQANSMARLVDGELRYPFVMQPAFLHGGIRLADPYVFSNPGARSSLEALAFEADFDRNSDGVPDYPRFSEASTATRYTTFLLALQTPPSSSSTPSSFTSFPGRFEPATGEFASSYELPLLTAYDVPLSWRPSRLRLGFSSQGYASAALPVTRPGQYDPARFRYGYLDLFPRQGTSAPLGAGQFHRVDHEYCLNEVQIEYSANGARFYNPTATLQGSFQGQDWMGQAADYSAQGKAWGIPAALGIPQSEAVTYAQTHGSVSFALPQGSYTVTPGATLVNASGQVNEATFQPLSLTVGCGQRLKLVPPLAVSIESQSLCASSASMTVSGRVRSSPSEVDRIWYLGPDGQEVTLCTQCGIDPGFSFPVTLNACDNDVQVYAFTAGMEQPALGQARLVWDDPADGPSCASAQCVNRAPVARCRSVTVPADSTCSGCGSVDEGSYDPDEGDTVSCSQSVSCPLAPGAHKVQLTCTDSYGLSSSCEATVTVRDTTPPEVTCSAGDDVDLVCTEGGAQAFYSASVRDNCGAASVSCTPASGSIFPGGTTSASCSAVDAAGNRASCSVPVAVEPVCPGPLKVTLCNQPAYTRDTTLQACGFVIPASGGPAVESTSFIVNGGAPIPVSPAPEHVNSGFVETAVTLQDGLNDIQLVGRTPSGYLTIKQQSLFVDREPPTFSILSPVEGQAIRSRSVTIRTSVEDNSPATVTAMFQAAGLPAGGGVTEHTFTFGEYHRGHVTLAVEARDAAGNTAEQQTVSVWVDFEPPVVTTDVPDGAVLSATPGNTLTYPVRVSSMSATTITLSNLPGQQFSLPRGGGLLEVRLPLQPAANTFDVHVTSETGQSTTLARTVHYNP